MTARDQYWLPAIVLGSSITVALFMMLPNMRFDRPIVDEPVIVIDFMPWREPEPVPKVAKPEVPKKQPPTKPRPKPKPTPHQAPVLPPEPKQMPEPVPEKQLSAQPEPEPEPVEEPPVPQPVEEPPAEPVQSSPEEVSSLEQLPKPAPLFRLTSMPRFAHKVEPQYPAVMRALGKEATVKLEVLIDRTGMVRKVTILQSGGDAFDKAATEALLSSNFVPGNIEGTPVAVRMRIPIRFSLR
ncbi:MAG: TonB family protein [Gammaproteobacteria bacterium]|jgi:protein TonB